MTWFKRTDGEGWTLIELIMVVALLGILGTMMIGTINPYGGPRADMTIQRMEALKRGMLGADYGESNEGKRNQFGFVGDIGRLPANLGELTTRGALPLYTFQTSLSVGAGWRGPYVSGGDSDAIAQDRDAWNRPFIYSTTSLSSLGQDGVAGGTAESTDLVVMIPRNQWVADVRGTLHDVNLILATATVQLYRPVDGVLTALVTTTDENGFYEFNSIPFGARTLKALDPVQSLAHPILIDMHPYQVPDTVFNFFGGSQRVEMQAGSIVSNPPNRLVSCAFISSYNYDVQLRAVYADWTGPPGTLDDMTINGVKQIFTGFNRTETHDVPATIVIPANSRDNAITLNFSQPKNSSTITFTFYWHGQVGSTTFTIVVP